MESGDDQGDGGGGAVRLCLVLAYDGTGFHGWQEQPGLRTVQGELRQRLARLLARPVAVAGAGRTDAGVHARGQVASLGVRNALEAERICCRLARLCPPDLQVVDARRVAPQFHARFSAIARRYSYHLLWRPDVFRARTALPVGTELDREAMDQAAAHFLGTRDFAGFCKQGSLHEGDGNVCRVDLCRFEYSSEGAILHIQADRFLHNMVRIVAGTLLETGRGLRRPADMPALLAARDRRLTGRTLPPHALFLEQVHYPVEMLAPQDRGTAPGAGAAEAAREDA